MSPQAASRRALADAYEQAVKAEADKRAKAAVLAKKSQVRRMVLAAGWLVTLAGSALLILKPDWFGLRPVPETAVEREASIRLGLYVAGRRLKLYHDQHGAYPDKLEEAGDVVPGIQYRRTADGGYEMRFERGGQILLLTSRDSLDAFVGPVARVLPRGR